MRKLSIIRLVKYGVMSLLAVFVVFGSSSCKSKKEKIFDTGRLDSTTYYNSYFDFRIDVPKNWYIFNRQKLTEASQNAVEAIPNKAMREQMARIMELQSVPLLTMFKTEPGTVSDSFNPSVQVIAENLKWYPEVKTGEHYLRQALQLFLASGMPYKSYDVPVTMVRMGGKPFYKMKLEADYGSYIVTQEWYSAVMNGFALNFGFTYDGLDLSQIEMMEKMKTSIKFK